MAKDRPSVLQPLQHGTFRNIWVANLVSSFGALIQGVGAAWMMTALTNSVDLVALVQASTSLPIMLFSLLGGAIADNFPRRRVMLVAQFFMLAVSALLTLSALLGLITPWLLLTFTFLIGCGTALNNPSWQASVGDLVPRSSVGSAVALNSIGFNLSRSLGPAVGGIIVAVAGAAAAFAVNLVSYLGLLFVLLRWKPAPAPAGLPREAVGAAMFAGVRYMALSPQLGKVLVRSFIFGLTASSVLALLPVVASQIPGGGPLVYGLLLGAFGLGAVGGALISARLAEQFSSEAIVRLAFVGFAICAATTGLSPSPWLTGVALMLGGACWVLALTLFNVTVQLSTPRWVVGRSLSLYQTATFAGLAAGSWLWGVAGEEFGVSNALVASAIALVVGAGVGLLLSIPPRVMLDLDPANRWQEPQIALPIEPRSGPIVISIEYKIRPQDVREFLRVMADRKRVRMRDGAREWVLRRDLSETDVWVESYKSPTWTEYARHNQRLTHADEVIGEKLRNLHQGPERPVVRRMIERPPNWFAAIAANRTIDPP
ncbi:ABC transporter permease [Devosia sp. Root413D1]|uniref:MFS transporter n=1 Tax=Devosia sp. Root413D1 TaxID=1736531 RepID=UPI0006F455F3|nr:MFS transporter [Devosia sp. Root413D1]KQW77028.1 ABC transporter permease [Devosia sp. Root413D1]